MGKSTISMAIFNSYVKLPEGTWDGDVMTGSMIWGWFRIATIPGAVEKDFDYLWSIIKDFSSYLMYWSIRNY